jgi:AcrR family transcriptional regulator
MKKKRIVKHPEVRKAEIMSVAKHLFETQGYEQTAVDEIIRSAGIAKGTFYYYFKSKREILIALVDAMVLKLEAHFKALLQDKTLSALTKLKYMVRGSVKNDIVNPQMMESVHLAENREMQEALNVRLVDTISPLFAEVLKQGYREKSFTKEVRTEEVQVILVGSQFILDSGLFHLSSEKRTAFLEATKNLLALLTGADPNLLDFIVKENESLSS